MKNRHVERIFLEHPSNWNAAQMLYLMFLTLRHLAAQNGIVVSPIELTWEQLESGTSTETTPLHCVIGAASTFASATSCFFQPSQANLFRFKPMETKKTFLVRKIVTIRMCCHILFRIPTTRKGVSKPRYVDISLGNPPRKYCLT